MLRAFVEKSRWKMGVLRRIEGVFLVVYSCRSKGAMGMSSTVLLQCEIETFGEKLRSVQ